MSRPVIAASPARMQLLRRNCACGGECEECRKKNLHRKPAAAHEFVKTPGLEDRALPFDLSRIRIHTEQGAMGRTFGSPSGNSEFASAAPAGIAAADLGGPSKEKAKPSDSAGHAPPPTAARTPDCHYSISYENPKNCSCEDSKCGDKDVPAFKNHCGGRIVFDITKITATGADCPKSLEGKELTEVVTSDHGCIHTSGVRTGKSPIGAGGVVTKGQDDYFVCLPRSEAPKLPNKGCTEVLTQKLFVDGVLAETHKITFKINKTSSGCTGTATRS